MITPIAVFALVLSLATVSRGADLVVVKAGDVTDGTAVVLGTLAS